MAEPPVARLRLVVDASVTCSAGDVNAAGRLARDCLTVTSSGQFLIVESDTLRAEWEAHPSRRYRLWLLELSDRELLLHIDPTPFADVHVAVSEIGDEGERGICEKDIHLVDAAHDTDNRLISADMRARVQFRRVAQRVPELGTLHWVAASEECVRWLTEGAPDAPELQLGST